MKGIVVDFTQTMKEVCVRHNLSASDWCIDMEIYNSETYGKVEKNTPPCHVFARNVMWRNNQPVLMDVVATCE